jgi:hypothetical protein
MAGSHSTNISFPSDVLAAYRWRYSFETDFISVWNYLVSESHINAATHFNAFSLRFQERFTD